MTHAVRAGLAALAITLSLGAAQAAGATSTYKATLAGASEVPATTSKGTGTLSATYDPATKTLAWTGSYSGLTGPATAAHFHGPAETGKNAGVLIPATDMGSAFTGTAMLDEAKAADLAAGKLYFNIHTAENPKGEIRGQVEPAK